MVKKMQEMKFENLKDNKGRIQAVEITVIHNCLYCGQKTPNVVFCSYGCKDRHYEKKRRELKND